MRISVKPHNTWKAWCCELFRHIDSIGGPAMNDVETVLLKNQFYECKPKCDQHGEVIHLSLSINMEYLPKQSNNENDGNSNENSNNNNNNSRGSTSGQAIEINEMCTIWTGELVDYEQRVCV